MDVTRYHILFQVICVLWAAFGIYWLIAAKMQDRSSAEPGLATNKVSDAPSARLFHHAMAAAAFIILFVPQTGVGVLNSRFLPRNLAFVIAGLIVTIAGLGLAVWARLHLAENWSSRVRIRSGHELVRTGPYAHLRHPIDSGILLGVIGTGITVGRWRALMSVTLILVSYCIKGHREDAVLAREFGDSWLEHRRHAGFLLPRF